MIKINPVDGSRLFSKVHGTLTLSEDGHLLITNKANDTFILEGKNIAELKKLINSHISVFGSMKVPRPQESDGKNIKYNIEVETFEQVVQESPIDR